MRGFHRFTILVPLVVVSFSFLAVAPAAALPPVPVTIQPVEGGLPPVTAGELKSFVVEKSVNWMTEPGNNDPPVQAFGDPKPAVLSATLAFDAEDPVDVAVLVGPLQGMAMPDEALGRPPLVLFVLGPFTFKGVIESLTIKYAAIEPDGTKSKAVVDVRIRQASAALVGIADH